MDIFRLFKKQKLTKETDANLYDFELHTRIESIGKYWTPELIDWVGKETNPITLSVAACLLNSWCYPSFMPSNPGDYSMAHKNNKILSYFIDDLIHMLENKSELICPGLHKKIRISGYYERFRS